MTSCDRVRDHCHTASPFSAVLVAYYRATQLSSPPVIFTPCLLTPSASSFPLSPNRPPLLSPLTSQAIDAEIKLLLAARNELESYLLEMRAAPRRKYGERTLDLQILPTFRRQRFLYLNFKIQAILL